MILAKYVSDFLSLYETLVINTNHIQDGSDKYGLFKSPSRDFVRRNDGSAVITEYYQFYAAQRSISEAERQEDDTWLEAFTYWVDDYPLKYEYPAIDGGRLVTNIMATGNPSPFRDDDNGITYQITLSISYEREVN